MKKRFLVIFFIISIGGAAFWLRYRSEGSVYAVTDNPVIRVTENGFVPAMLAVRVGQPVTFFNENSRATWPASNPHPTHVIYGAFDPREPIAPGDSWQFIFQKTGEWRYHDHLFPSFTGKIMVVDVNGKIEAKLRCSDLKKLTRQEKEQCWDELVSSGFEKKGVEGAYAVFRTLYATDQDFVTSGCHGHAHRIGDAFYGLYARRRDVKTLDFPPETVYCGYGFYHGLFEHLFRDKPDVPLAKDICSYLDERVGKTIPRIRLNCYHGIGHGFMKEPTDKRLWGNASDVLEPALAVCDGISDNPLEVQECLQGSFNVIAEWSWAGQFGLVVDRDDPLALCRQQAHRARAIACYYEMSMHLNSYSYGHDDLVTFANQFINSIDDDDIARTIIHTQVAGMMERGVVKSDHAEYIRVCHELPTRLQPDCVSGVVAGLMAHGEPEREYIKALALCSSQELTDDEEHSCYQDVARMAKEMYAAEKVAKVCELFPGAYQGYCRTE